MDGRVVMLDAGPDAAPARDAGDRDATADSGPVDGGPHDSGVPDSGVPDSGVPDSGPPDSGPVCTESPCRLVEPQCGCAAGEGCYREASGPVACATAGTRPEGSSCDFSTDCTPGNICTGQPSGGCWRLCESDSDCVAPSRCVFDVYDSSGSVVPGPRICARNCDPVTNTGCPSGWACTVRWDDTPPYTYCRGFGTAGTFQACASESDCAAGHACLREPTTGNRICYPWCSAPGTVAECGSGQACYFYVTVGTTDYGVCGSA